MSIKLESNWIKILTKQNTLDWIQGLLLENWQGVQMADKGGGG